MDLTTCNGECVCVQDHYGARPEEEGSAKTKGLFQRVAAWRRARWRSRSTSEKHDNISEHRSPNNVYDPAASHSPGSSRDRGGIGTNEPRNEQDLVEMRRYDQADDPEVSLRGHHTHHMYVPSCDRLCIYKHACSGCWWTWS